MRLWPRRKPQCPHHMSAWSAPYEWPLLNAPDGVFDGYAWQQRRACIDCGRVEVRRAPDGA